MTIHYRIYSNFFIVTLSTSIIVIFSIINIINNEELFQFDCQIGKSINKKKYPCIR